MNGIIEDEFAVPAPSDVGYTVACTNPPYPDPLASATEDTLNNNSDFLNFEDIELNLTGSIIKTKHASTDNNFAMITHETPQPDAGAEERNAEEEVNAVELHVGEGAKSQYVDIGDLEDLIKCDKIDIKALETQIENNESDILSEIDEINVVDSDVELKNQQKPKETENISEVENDTIENIGKQEPGAIETLTTTTLPEPSLHEAYVQCHQQNLNQTQIVKLEEVIPDISKEIQSPNHELQTSNGEPPPPPPLMPLRLSSSPNVPPPPEPSLDDITEGEELNCEEELRSDGSDSGLGSEPSHNSSLSLVVIEQRSSSCSSPKASSSSSSSSSLVVKQAPPVVQLPPKSSLKRRSSDALVVVEETEASSSCISSSSLSSSSNNDGSSAAKRQKRNIQFDGVTVYYFPRQQGFSCVPSQGGCSLGMANTHNQIRYYTLAEHSAEQRKYHRMQLAELNPRSSSSEETDSDEEPSESSSDADSEVYGFLQPVSAKQRRTLLKAAGVRKIDSSEKDECRLIRTSREVCGCSCRVYCDPETCSCSQGGIKCQVDRQNFPCGCTRDGCGNVVGRMEFNPGRVRTHYIHTVMRLEMENKQEKMQSVVQHPVAIVAPVAQVPSILNPNALQPLHQHPQQQQQWRVPAQNLSMCDFNMLYPNPGQPAVVDRLRGVPTSVESLDLHYAYRDDYNPPTTYPSTAVVYDTTSYLDTVPCIETPYDTGAVAAVYSPLQHSFATTTQLQPAESSRVSSFDQFYYTTEPQQTTGVPHPKPIETPPTVIDHQQNSYISLAGPGPARIDVINNLLETNRFTQPVNEEHDETSQQQPAVVLHEPESSNENLNEIIKSSIVETVSV